MNVVEANGLRRHFGRLAAVDGLDLQVRPGELVGLVGPDGAGKTTALRLLATIMLPTGGEGRVLGLDIVRDAEAIKRRIGYMPQRFSLYGELTVQENMDFFADIFRIPDHERQERFRRVLEFSRLGPFRGRLARDLSGGMKQKLALSCALIHTPEVLFLDEPTTGVDPISRRELWRLLLDLWRRGTTIIIATPYMDEAERCERIGFMQRGRLLDYDAPARFKARYPFEVIELVCEDRQRARTLVARHAGIEGVETLGDRLHVRVRVAAEWLPRLQALLTGAGIEVREVAQVRPSVEDVFLHLAREDHVS
ncbi:MAG: ABC transporter ATP-binding protein [Acidobacteria bacterium]|nr:ABC transporter ATP-binding protein [Acidobacteriota bacterium]